MADILDALVEYKLSLLPTGSLMFEIGHVATPEEAIAGHVQWVRLAITVKQSLQLAEDLRQKATSSRQTPDAGHA